MLSGALKSKTMWFGFLLSVLGLVQQYADLLRAVLPEKYFGALMAVVGVVVMVLRAITGESLADKSSDSLG